MGRTHSTASINALMAQNTDEAFHLLITIKSNTGTVLERFTSDAVDTVVGADTFTPYPFDLHLPKNVDGQISTTTLSLDNVSRDVIESLRSTDRALQVDMKVVLASDTSDTMVEFTDYELRQVSYDPMTISGQLTLENFLAEPVGRIMSGNLYPGLVFK